MAKEKENSLYLKCNSISMTFETLDIVGWIATVIIICSFLINNMLWLRIVNLVGALLWLTYGILDLSSSIIFLNVVIVSIQLFKITSILKKRKTQEALWPLFDSIKRIQNHWHVLAHFITILRFKEFINKKRLVFGV